MLISLRTAVLLAATFCQAGIAAAETLSSHQILPANFKPPQVFKHVNLVRTLNLDKSYVRERINVVVENVGKEPHTEYYIPFDAATISHVGGLEVREKDETTKPALTAEIVEYDADSSTQFYRVTFLEPLKPQKQIALVIVYHVLSAASPLPVAIAQADQQYLQYVFSEYAPSAYPTAKQKTKVKFPNGDVPDATGKPEKEGSTYTYGPFSNVPAGATSMQRVRYEFTQPLIYATLVERDIEVSHWGGNVAFEERWQLTNRGAVLSKNFNRVEWATHQYYSPPTSAIKRLTFPLKPGSLSPYYTDEIGNISTSNFVPGSGKRDGRLDLRPRYPVFGGWSHPFRVGWANELSGFLRHLGGRGSSSYVLNVPFLEGPRAVEGIAYEKVVVRVILPEGASNVRFSSAVALASNATSAHRTFMDTLGRTAITLTALNLNDEARDKPLIVTYDYTVAAALRKPLTIFAGFLAVFAGVWAICQMDMSIGKKKML